MNTKQLIIKILKKNKKSFILFMLLFIFGSAANAINPYVASRLIGSFELGSKEAVIANLKFWLIVFFIAKSLQALNQYGMRVTKKVFEMFFLKDLKSELFETVHAHAIRYFDDEMTGRISSAINSASRAINSLFTNLLFSLIRPMIHFLTGFGIIAYTCPKLALTLTILCIPSFISFKSMYSKVIALFKQRSTSEREYKGITADSYSNYKAVRYTGSVFSEKLHAYKALKKYLRITWSAEKYHSLLRLGIGTSETIFTLACYFTIIFFTAKETLSLADAVFAFSAIQMLSTSIHDFADATIFAGDNYGELSSNIELINKPIEIKDKPNAKKLVVKDNTLTIKNITFSYLPEKTVLKNLNLTIPANQKVGLIGHSGAGKSTLISLILRAYEPEKGKILIGKTDITDVTQTSLHQNIAYVPQDVTLFNRTLKENLKAANPKSSDKDIIKATKLAYIHDTIMSLPDGYDSIVGERGILLSGGERQRIAIARAILQDAPILILDEATASLDSEAEVAVQNAIENMMKNKTVIAIAHRLSTLRAMDRIIALENGEIVEDGTPKELLKKKDGLFKHLFDLQTNGYIMADTKNKEEN